MEKAPSHASPRTVLKIAIETIAIAETTAVFTDNKNNLDDAIDVNNDNYYEVSSSSSKEKKATTDIVDVAIVTPINSPGGRRHNNISIYEEKDFYDSDDEGSTGDEDGDKDDSYNIIHDTNADFLEYILNSLGIDIMCGLDDITNDNNDIVNNNNKMDDKYPYRFINPHHNRNNDDDKSIPTTTTRTPVTTTTGRCLIVSKATTRIIDGVRCNNTDGSAHGGVVEYYKFPGIHTDTDDIFTNSSLLSPLSLCNGHELGGHSLLLNHRLDPFVDEHDALFLCGNTITDLCEPSEFYCQRR